MLRRCHRYHNGRLGHNDRVLTPEDLVVAALREEEPNFLVTGPDKPDESATGSEPLLAIEGRHRALRYTLEGKVRRAAPCGSWVAGGHG